MDSILVVILLLVVSFIIKYKMIIIICMANLQICSDKLSLNIYQTYVQLRSLFLLCGSVRQALVTKDP